MWSNKEVKREARKTLKKRYFTIVFMCFIVVFLGIVYGFGDTISSFKTDNSGIASSIVEKKSTSELTKQAEKNATEAYTESILLGNDKAKEAIANNMLASFQGTGGFLYNIMFRITKLITANDMLAKGLIFFAILIYILYFIFIKDIIYVGFLRSLMEHRVYSKTSFLRMFCMFRQKGFMKIAYVMIVRALVLTLYSLLFAIPIALGALIYIAKVAGLWSLILGILISIPLLLLLIKKYYELYAIPFNAACNPTLGVKNHFALSKAMMDGNKAHMFGLEVSFVPWSIVSALTFGLFDLFYLTPYRYLTYTNAYMRVRQNAIDTRMYNADTLVDGEGDLLVNPPEGAEVYPVDRKQNKFSKFVGDLNPQRHYSVINLLLMFFIFAMVGKGWEVLLHIVKDGEFVNRGTLYGPWLPIYGAAGALILFLLRKLTTRPAILFVAIMALCGTFEYITSWYLQATKGLQYWNYSNYFMNVNGRICLEGLLVFAILGMLFLYIGGPLIDNLLNKINIKLRIGIFIVLVIAFVADILYAREHPKKGHGITDYEHQSKMALFEKPDGVDSVTASEFEAETSSNPIIRFLAYKC